MGAAVSYFITHAEVADVIFPDLIELGGDAHMTSGSQVWPCSHFAFHQGLRWCTASCFACR